ncbi:hypothetical protein C0992_007389, partial [Termitomyces sp. T32_za158]
MSRAEDQVSNLTTSLATMQQKFLQPYPHLDAITSPSTPAIASANNPLQVPNVTPRPLSRKRTHDDINTSSSAEPSEPMGPQIQVDTEMSDEEMGMIEEQQVGQQIFPSFGVPEAGDMLAHVRSHMFFHPLHSFFTATSEVIAASLKICDPSLVHDLFHTFAQCRSSYNLRFASPANPFTYTVPLTSLRFLPQNFLHFRRGLTQPQLNRGKLKNNSCSRMTSFRLSQPTLNTFLSISCPAFITLCILSFLCLDICPIPTFVKHAHQQMIHMSCSVACLMCLPLLTCPLNVLATIVSRSDHGSSPHRHQTLRLLIVFILITTSYASIPLKTIALNANGLADPIKIHHIQTTIRGYEPHAFVIGETKSTQKVSQRLHLPGYKLFESSGRPSGKQRGKWGVIVGIHSNISVTNPISLDPSLQGRAVALDLVIPTSAGKGFPHRFIGIYAPWDPGNDNHSQSTFWPTLSTVCQAAPFSWSIHGDCNATLSQLESTSLTRSPSPAQIALMSFINDTLAIDIWSTIPDRSPHTHYTYKPYSQTRPNEDVKSIIDRAIVSRQGVSSATIEVITSFLPATDHRPILSRIVLIPPPSHSSASPSLSNEIPPAAYNPRFRYPFKKESIRLHAFSSYVDNMIDDTIVNIPIVDDQSFQIVYRHMSQCLLNSATSSFTLTKRASTRTRKPMTPTIRLILTQTYHINRIIGSLNQSIQHGGNHWAAPSEPWATELYNAFLNTQPATVSFSPTEYRSFLRQIRRKLHKLRFAEERQCLKDWNLDFASRQIACLLQGGSARKLYSHQFSDLPRALSIDSELDSFITDPEGIKRSTQSYFTTLYKRTPRPPQPKPWLTTPSVHNISLAVRADPFTWPQLMSLDDLRRMSNRGNTRPTPGPDRWEKWFLRFLSDRALKPILDLINYILRSSHFPDVIKPIYVSTIHKKGSPTILSNYRGIACSNVLCNLPFAWLNYKLGPYLAKHSIIPPFQIATQPG